MIVVVLGFHKSGTTLVAKTLAAAGFDMGAECEGAYPKCKYEDPRAKQIALDILFDGRRRKSLDLPTSYHEKREEIREYIDAREYEAAGRDWGFKVPDLTLCYSLWRQLLPKHLVIGIRRSLEGVLAHYSRRRNPPDPAMIKRAWFYYNYYLCGDRIPTVHFEDIIENGIEPIETIIGRRLPDVRLNRGIS